MVERLRSSDSENQAVTTTGGSMSLASTTGSERTRRACASARLEGKMATAAARRTRATAAAGHKSRADKGLAAASDLTRTPVLPSPSRRIYSALPSSSSMMVWKTSKGWFPVTCTPLMNTVGVVRTPRSAPDCRSPAT